MLEEVGLVLDSPADATELVIALLRPESRRLAKSIDRPVECPQGAWGDESPFDPLSRRRHDDDLAGWDRGVEERTFDIVLGMSPAPEGCEFQG